MNKDKINLIKIKENGTALMMALLILTGVLTVSLVAADLIVNSIKTGRSQSYSTKAYFAAEAGAERSLWEVRKNTENPLPNENEENIFTEELGSGSVYHVDYASSSPAVIFTSTGVFRGVYRAVETSFTSQSE